MAWLSQFIKRVRAATPAARRSARSDFDGELRACFDLIVERYRAEGYAASEAKRLATLEFGDIDQIKDHVYLAARGRRRVALLRDLVYASRAIRRLPGVTAAAVLTLGLGIGVTAAIFSAVDAVLVQAFPYPHADQLALVWSSFEKSGAV